jgi:hypothetical protein
MQYQEVAAVEDTVVVVYSADSEEFDYLLE